MKKFKLDTKDIMGAVGFAMLFIGISFISWKAALIIGGAILFVVPIWGHVWGCRGVKNGDHR